MRFIAFLIATVLWIPIGLVLWIPFIVRMLTVYMANVLVSVYQNRDTKKSEDALNYALHFYGHGFAVIGRILQADQKATGNGPDADGLGSIMRTVSELVFALIFWLTTLLVLHEIGASTIFNGPQPARPVGSFSVPASGTLSWTVNHWIFPDTQYTANITLVSASETQSRWLFFWLKDTATVTVTYCNTSEDTIHNQTFYLWYVHPDKSMTANWNADVGELKSGSCEDLTMTTTPTGHISGPSFQGQFSASMDENLSGADISVY